jgi:hypothetical protein
MNVKNAAAVLIAVTILFASAPSQQAQDASKQQQSTEQQDKDKPTPEKKAVLLIDQIVGEAGVLKLPENRIYVQITAGDMLWDRDEARARALMVEAAGNIASLLQTSNPTDRRSANANRIAQQLRQQLVLTAGRHDGALAYSLLQSMPTPPPANGPGMGRPDGQGNLEQNLVAVIAANDPKAAIKNTQEWLDKGQYPSSIQRVLSQVQQKDADSAAKLADKLVTQLQPDELLAKQDATRLSLNILRAGPRPEKKPSGAAQPATSNTDQILSQTAFRDLMSATITAALRATPQPPGNTQRGPGGFRGGPGGPRAVAPPAPQSAADLAQANARALLSGLQTMLQQVDATLPERSLAVRQKLTQMGMDNDQRGGFGQIQALMQQGTSDSLMTAAASAPAGMQSRIYQQAAMKALDEGNTDRAREIANQHLDDTTRANVLRSADLKQTVKAASADKMDDIRKTIASAKSDEERLSLLLEFAESLEGDSPKLALQLYDEARNMVSRRATSYSQFESQLEVADAVADLDPARAFDTLEPGINQLNDLLGAAAALSGFELNLFRDGELPLQNGSQLSGIVTRYGAELAELAKKDFERAQTTADKFQLPESRILAKLALVRGVLGLKPIESNNDFGGGRGFGQFGRRQQ